MILMSDDLITKNDFTTSRPDLVWDIDNRLFSHG
jgi:hypothetical protein